MILVKKLGLVPILTMSDDSDNDKDNGASNSALILIVMLMLTMRLMGFLLLVLNEDTGENSDNADPPR